MHQGEYIRDLINQEGKTQKSVADSIGIKPTTMTDLLKRESIQIDHLANLSKVLKENLLLKFYPEFAVKQEQSSILSVNDGEISEHIKEKYRLQGRVEQLEKLLKTKMAQEIAQPIIESYDEALSNLSSEIKKLYIKFEEISKPATGKKDSEKAS